MSKRLAYLEKVAAEGTADSFALYALALEYKSLERPVDAVATFERLKASDPSYLPMYLMCGTMLLDAGFARVSAQLFKEILVVQLRARSC